MKEGKYADIIGLVHHTSKTRQRMPVSERAAQFSPFAALKGYEEGIEEAARDAEDFNEDEARAQMLEETLQALKDCEQEQPLVRIVYFVKDEKKEGGRFSGYEGRLRKIDLRRKTLVLEGTEIAFSQIKELEF